ncbi:MAG: DUF3047 domain-containing protein [Candidatus Latescibacterota bacterium]|nr:DUF3047 domain-containing protein [Candidatus Latescibacterota bacterium]
MIKRKFFILLSGLVVCCGSSWSQSAISLDMSHGWTRRDWFDCEDASRMSSDRNSLTIATDSSAALYWQVPTKQGPIPIDGNLGWVEECGRPPRNFVQKVANGPKRKSLLDVSDYRYFSWKWNVTNTIDDKNTIDRNGKIRPEGDDFAAKLGIAILKKGTNEPRERSYVWTRNLPEESVLLHEKKILFWQFRYHRIVAQSGEKHVGEWVSEARDLCADYKRMYPGEEPGKIVRIYVMSDSDNTASEVTGTYSNLTFHTHRPDNVSPSK